MQPPDVLLAFLSEFNQARYWESHEVLEGAWRKSRSFFYHALILYASAWVHRQRGNLAGIAAQLNKADPILERYAPHYLGVNVESLLRDSAELRRLAREDRLGDVSVPSITMDPGLIRGDEAELD